jgi:hypothetical protein
MNADDGSGTRASVGKMPPQALQPCRHDMWQHWQSGFWWPWPGSFWATATPRDVQMILPSPKPEATVAA